MKINSKQKLRTVIVGVIGVILLAAVSVSVFWAVRYSPSKKMMNGYEYFQVSQGTGKTLVLIDGEAFGDTGIYVDDLLYLPQEFVADYINARFYYDSESNGILYTDDKNIYTFLPDKEGYTDESGAAYHTEYAVVKQIEGVYYLAWEYVAEYTECEFVYGSEPSRVNITTLPYEVSCVTAERKTAVRYRGGIKSKVLENVEKGTRLIFRESYDDWIEVVTPSGYMGYVKASDVSQPFDYAAELKNVGKYAQNKFDEAGTKINLAWFQVGGTAGNESVDSMLQSSNINVISPTWYSITDESGLASSYASASFVQKMHNRGIQVWPLINDFDTEINYARLYSSKAAREQLISTLIKDAEEYGYDGINLDFEHIKSEYAKDFLQFVRELSLECRRHDLILSSDNYKPAPYNAHYNLTEQSAFVDYIIIMAYDEHYAGSDAGSVASLPFVKEAVSDTLKLVERERVVIGIPFYTRIWTVKGSETTSRAVAMQTAINDMNADGQVALWNEDVGQYVCSYEKNGATKMIWFEEEKSIEEKMKVISESNTAGVAEWKLGLEKPTIWSVIGKYL